MHIEHQEHVYRISTASLQIGKGMSIEQGLTQIAPQGTRIGLNIISRVIDFLCEREGEHFIAREIAKALMSAFLTYAR